MSGKMIDIFDESGEKERLLLFCTFTFEDEHYILARSESGGDICRPLFWRLWNGTYQSYDDVSDEIINITRILYSKANENPDRFPFKGENYAVRKAKKGGGFCYGFKRERRSPLLSPLMLNLSMPFRLAASVILAAVLTFTYMNSFSFTWATVAFPHITRGNLKILLYMGEIIGAVLIFAVRNRSRMLCSLFLNAFIPLGVITLIGIAKLYKTIRILTVCAACVILALGFLPQFVIAFTTSRKKTRLKRLRRAFSGMYTPILICLFAFLLYAKIFNLAVYTRPVVARDLNDSPEKKSEQYEAVCANINKNVWPGLTPEEKEATLQIICDHECEEVLGCKTAEVRSCRLSGTTLGTYEHVLNRIFINEKFIREGSAYEVLHTLLHETRHAYQHAVVRMFNKVEGDLDEEMLKLPVFDYAAAMRNNFDNYIISSVDEYSYKSQEAEQDSNAWATFRMQYNYSHYINIDEPAKKTNGIINGDVSREAGG